MCLVQTYPDLEFWALAIAKASPIQVEDFLCLPSVREEETLIMAIMFGASQPRILTLHRIAHRG